MTKSGDGGKYLVGRFGPDKGLRGFIRGLQIASDGGFQLPGAAENATPQLFFCQRREPALDQVQPGGAGGGEMEMIPGTFGQPALNDRGLMGGVVNRG